MTIKQANNNRVRKPSKLMLDCNAPNIYSCQGCTHYTQDRCNDVKHKTPT